MSSGNGTARQLEDGSDSCHGLRPASKGYVTPEGGKSSVLVIGWEARTWWPKLFQASQLRSLSRPKRFL